MFFNDNKLRTYHLTVLERRRRWAMYEMVDWNGEFWAAQYPSSVVGRRGLSHGNIATHHRQYSPIYNGSFKSYGQIVGTEN